MESIKVWREALGATQQDMAKALGVDRSTIGKWELPNSYPRPKFLPQIASFLGCTIEHLYEYKTPFSLMSEEDSHHHLFQRGQFVEILCKDQTKWRGLITHISISQCENDDGSLECDGEIFLYELTKPKTYENALIWLSDILEIRQGYDTQPFQNDCLTTSC